MYNIVLNRHTDGSGDASLVDGNGVAVETGMGFTSEFEDATRDRYFDCSLISARMNLLININAALSELALSVKRLEIVDEMIADRDSDHALPPIEKTGVERITAIRDRWLADNPNFNRGTSCN